MNGKTERGLIFDKDGTLIDFEATWFPIVAAIMDAVRTRYGASEEAMRAAADSTGVLGNGFAKESLMQSETTSSLSRIWADALEERGCRVEAEAIEDLFAETAEAMAHRVVLVPGAVRLLERLKGAGFRLAVATSDNRRSTESGLERAGILRFFDFIAADGDGLPAKPAPDAALEFGLRFGLEPKEMTVFGDSRGDMLFAQRAGARFVGMRTACNAHERFSAAGYPTIADFSDEAAVRRLIA